MGLLERINARLALPARPQNLSFDEYASWFSFGGSQYPLLQTTYSQVDQERIAWTADWAAKSSGPVFSLVLARMQVFSQVRFQWTRFNGAQPGDLFGSSELSVLEQPWPGGTTADLLARMEWDASAAGNAYVRRKGSSLHMLNPNWVIIVLGSQEDADNPASAPDTTLAGYLWVPPGGRARFFQPSQVAHYAPLPDPDRHFLGMSWITPVLRDLQGDQMATEHKYKFFENGATPNLAIRFDPTVSLANVKAFKELMEVEHRGAANAFKTLYLGGGGDPKAVGSTFKDMDYAVIQGRAESRLASAAGVPPSWVAFFEGMQGSTLNAGNYDSARRRFSDGTMAHLWGNAASSLQSLLAAPKGASLWYDNRIPFMREDAKDLATVQSQEASTIANLIRDGFIPDSVVAAVRNNDWGLLKHSGLTSVQLVPPSSGQEPVPGFSPGTPPGPAPASANGKEVARR
ncbi:phage portal protein [Streptomyces sp. NPDC006333]|uniref:phage portal protein n=1 Tax=Streptomyces sp. NPDC006333 TaxID=3156753 RepID=UPI0033ADAF72